MPLILKAMHSAIESGELKTVQWLLDIGAPLDEGLPDCLGCSPLLVAFFFSRKEIVKFLLERDAPVRGQACHKFHSRRGHDPLLLATRMGDVDIFREILNRSGKGILEQPVQAIHVAAACDQLEILEILVDHYLGSNTKAEDHPKAGTDVLVQSKSTVIPGRGILPQRSMQTQNTLDVRIRTDLMQEEWSLGPKVKASGWLSMGTALHVACFTKHERIVSFLVDSGANVEDTNAELATPLHIASRAGPLSMVQRLLSAGANVNCQDICGRTALMYALTLSGERQDILRALISHGTVVKARDINGDNALDWALRCANPTETLPILIQQNEMLTSINPVHHRTIAHVAMAQSSIVLHNFVFDRIQDLAVKIPLFGNLLNVACYHGQLHPAKTIIAKVPPDKLNQFVNNRSARHYTPLYAAAYRGNIPMMASLIEAGADIEGQGGEFGTPLMAACAIGRIDAVKYLIGKGAKLEYVSEDGESRSGMEAAERHPRLLAWLRGHVET